MTLFLLIIGSYLIGSIPSAYIAGRLIRQIDIRDHGSGNMGATNVFRVLGKGAGITVLVADILKGVIAVGLLPQVVDGLLPLEWFIYIGVAAICGHNWTIFLNFRGGKGIATSLGVLIGFSFVIPQFWIVLLTVLSVFIVLLLLFRYVSLGSISAAVMFPIMVIVTGQPFSLLIFAIVIAIFVIVRHKSNISRLIQGNESKIPAFWIKKSK